MALSCIISEIKREIGRFSYSLAFGAPVRGVPVGILPYRFYRLVRKNKYGVTTRGEKCLLFSRFDNTGVYGQTDIFRQHILRAMHSIAR